MRGANTPSRWAHTTIFANKTSSYNAITVYKATKYQIYKTGTINKLTCLETYPSQPGGPLKGPADFQKNDSFFIFRELGQLPKIVIF